MTPERAERRLAAILAADAVGYSRLMEADEETTVRTLSVFRDIIDGLVASHRGRVFGGAGDSVVADFASPVEAVRCALEIQRYVEDRNAGLPADRRMRFRIGINLGDVMVEGENLLGDGVNVAARLESLADPGGICIAASVLEQVEGKLDIGYTDLGEREVKNISRPVRVYQVHRAPDSIGKIVHRAKPKAKIPRWPALSAGIAVLVAALAIAVWRQPWEPTIEPASVARMAFPLPGKPSIAVLPFMNLSDDPSQDYFAQGMADDLITDLSKISGLFVIARNSSFAYRGQHVSVRQVAEDLGVRYILEGSVRRAGDQVRINAQLIDAVTGGYLWAERYEGSIVDLFALQDGVIGRIVSALSVELTASDRKTLANRRETVNLEAYDFLLRGRQLLSRIEGQDTEKARAMFEKAIEIDPGYARAYLNLGLLHLDEWGIWGRSRDPNLARALELGQKAAELDPTSSGAHVLLASAYQTLGEHDKAEAEVKIAIALNPTHPETLGGLGQYLAKAGSANEAIDVLTKAMRLDPYHPPQYHFYLGRAYFALARYEEAIEALRQGARREPNYIAFHLWLAASYAMLDRGGEARTEVAEVLRLNPDFTLSAYADWVRSYTPRYNLSELERRLTALRKAGLPD